MLFISCKSTKTEVEHDHQSETILLRQPYLQNAYADSVSILWITNKGENTYVKYGKSGEPDTKVYGTVVNEGNKVRSTVTIKDIERGATYFYAIYTDDKLLASGDDYFFRTEPDSDVAKFSFYAMGDIGEPLIKGGFPHITSNQINNLERKPDFGIGLGDIIYPDGESSFADAYLFKPMEPILKNIPFYPALGNHDWHVDPNKNFEKEWKLPNNEHYYSFDYVNAHFIALDTRDGVLYDAENQVQWFEKDLIQAQAKYDWIFVYFHHNGKTCTYKRDYQSVIDLYPLFSKYNVDIVLNGHAHTYERLHPLDASGNVIETYRNNIYDYPLISNGFIQITTGAGGKIKKNWKPYVPGACMKNIVAANAHRGHFSLLKIAGKRLEFQAISSIGGEVLDAFVISK
ncbi:metallophosphoesterase family protein [Seonamhaeicola sp.]|uniref:metallophosphoesterase n=1 Tax=Seonamhaeicola sp. TaxID=1912245 RepID=UPI00261BA72D|nr:metallophosphoesterase family protein [Seonamhaeicola sp.]